MLLISRCVVHEYPYCIKCHWASVQHIIHRRLQYFNHAVELASGALLRFSSELHTSSRKPFDLRQIWQSCLLANRHYTTAVSYAFGTILQSEQAIS